MSESILISVSSIEGSIVGNFCVEVFTSVLCSYRSIRGISSLCVNASVGGMGFSSSQKPHSV